MPTPPRIPPPCALRSPPVALLVLVLALAACAPGGAAPRVPAEPPAGAPGRPGTDAEREAARKLLPRPDGFADTPSAMGHVSPSRQASTWITGPRGDALRVQVADLEEALGKAVGTSPWHVVSTRRYREAGAVTLWGATLTDAYRFVVDGERFEALDRFAINTVASSIPWNLVGADDGRVYVPDPNGHIAFGAPPTCRRTHPVVLVLHDDPTGSGSLDGPIECLGVLELVPEALLDVCGVADARLLDNLSGNSLVPGFGGELATVAVFEDGSGARSAHLVIFAAGASAPSACGLIDDGNPTNEIAAEALGDGITAFYVATGDALVKMTWNRPRGVVERSWERQLGLRRRTGTTPTLVDTASGERFVVLVDGSCATSNVLNGLITCDADGRPSVLVAVRRDDDPGERPAVLRSELPAWLRTVENSPAVLGDTVVVANYSGYLPNGLLVPPGGEPPQGGAGSWGTSPDAEPDVATGLVALTWSERSERFEVAWTNPDTQVNGVPTISGGANRVYGVGAEAATGRTYLYGFRLEDDAAGPAGERLLRVELGGAPFREAVRSAAGDLIFRRGDYRLREGEVFDAGNQIVLLEDGSLVVSGGRALVRVRDAAP